MTTVQEHATSLPPAPIRRAPTGLAADLRAIKVVTHRELLRWGTDRRRMLAGLIQPLLWLFVLGTGLSRVVETGSNNINFRTFLFPGVLAMSVIFTAVFAGVSVVWDREFGFLREMLVAPIRRGSILAGKCIGGAIVATSQAVVILALAGLAGVPYSPVLMIELVLVLFLAAMAVTAVGLLLGARVSRIESVMPMIQTVVTPMMFLSGALYPTSGLPVWLSFATKINPVTYAVQPMRHILFSHVDMSPAASRLIGQSLTWNGWPVPLALQIGVLLAVGSIVFGIAVKRFSKTD